MSYFDFCMGVLVGVLLSVMWATVLGLWPTKEINDLKQAEEFCGVGKV